MPENEELNTQQRVLAEMDITDEMRIQFAVDELYETMKTFDGDNEKFRRIKLMRNNIVNMMDTYLKKFNNKPIMEDFYKKLERAKQQATNNGRVNKYIQFMSEMRVIQEFKGIKENIAEKLGEQLFELFKDSEVILHATTKNDDSNR